MPALNSSVAIADEFENSGELKRRAAKFRMRKRHLLLRLAAGAAVIAGVWLLLQACV